MASNITILSPNKIDMSKMNFVVGQAKAGRNPPINMKHDGQNFQIRLPAKVQIPSGVWVREDAQNGSKSYTAVAVASIDTADNVRIVSFSLLEK